MIWKFVDKGQKPIMSISINEILTNAAISSNSSFKLYYVDKEYPVWRLLTSVFVEQLQIEKKENKSPSSKYDKTTLLYIVVALIIVFWFLLLYNRKVRAAKMGIARSVAGGSNLRF